jgi:primosomal protein N' (replication factor Y)
VAQKLAQITGAVLVLGSATPDVETYYHAQRGRHRLLELPQRIGQDGARELAPVELCDMRRELREGNRSIFSRGLSQALHDCLNQGRQAILFLNRRGSAPIVQCRDCGYVATCPSCSVSLTYHAADARLACHRCNRRVRPPQSCRQCGGAHIRRLGVGTQRVVEEVATLLPGVRVDRWDADASRAGVAPEEIMARLASGEIQVLVGTQMVAKGLDLPNVTLVGVVLADIGLHLPDFRAGERGFSLLCQVAGRAGRGDAPGRVIIQTYSPEHYAVAAAAHQDYAAMYRQEVEVRRRQGNPPFGQLVHLVFQEINPSLCQRQAMELARALRQKVQAQGLTDVTVVGPAPGIPSRLRGRHRWHLLLRGRNLHRFLEGVNFPPACAVDVDPAHVL